MTGTIKVIKMIDSDILEKLEGEIEASSTIIHFDLKSVKAFYLIEEGDEKYLYTNIGGHEYPLVHEDILEAAFIDYLNEDNSSISA